MTLPANVEQHNALTNTASTHSLHVTGYVVANYAAMIALANAQANDLAYFPMNGFQTQWIYDTNVGGGTWRILSPFYATSGTLPVLGLQNGDEVVLSDTGQVGFYNKVSNSWNYVT